MNGIRVRRTIGDDCENDDRDRGIKKRCDDDSLSRRVSDGLTLASNLRVELSELLLSSTLNKSVNSVVYMIDTGIPF